MRSTITKPDNYYELEIAYYEGLNENQRIILSNYTMRELQSFNSIAYNQLSPKKRQWLKDRGYKNVGLQSIVNSLKLITNNYWSEIENCYPKDIAKAFGLVEEIDVIEEDTTCLPERFLENTTTVYPNFTGETDYVEYFKEYYANPEKTQCEYVVLRNCIFSHRDITVKGVARDDGTSSYDWGTFTGAVEVEYDWLNHRFYQKGSNRIIDRAELVQVHKNGIIAVIDMKQAKKDFDLRCYEGGRDKVKDEYLSSFDPDYDTETFQSFEEAFEHAYKEYLSEEPEEVEYAIEIAEDLSERWQLKNPEYY